MTAPPHPDPSLFPVACAVITVSDTRVVETDSSGREIREALTRSGHRVALYRIVPDAPDRIRSLLREVGESETIDALIFNGGTGIAPRDTTYDTLVPLLEKTLPGFGEIFRYLSYSEIGSRALASRALAGSYRGRLVFSLPGSTNAVKLALEKLILPEIRHLIRQIRG